MNLILVVVMITRFSQEPQFVRAFPTEQACIAKMNEINNKHDYQRAYCVPKVGD